MVNALTVLVWLLFGHCIADFALQSDFVARAKSRTSPFGKDIWPIVLSAHAGIHGACVGVVLHVVAGASWPLATVFAVAEFCVHWITDFGKCENWYSFHTDQGLHIAVKFVWLGLLLGVLMPLGMG